MYAPLTIAAAWVLQGIQVADIPTSFSSVADMAERFLAPMLEEFRAGLAQDMVVKSGEPTPERPVSIIFVDGDDYFCDRVGRGLLGGPRLPDGVGGGEGGCPTSAGEGAEAGRRAHAPAQPGPAFRPTHVIHSETGSCARVATLLLNVCILA